MECNVFFLNQASFQVKWKYTVNWSLRILIHTIQQAINFHKNYNHISQTIYSKRYSLRYNACWAPSHKLHLNIYSAKCRPFCFCSLFVPRPINEANKYTTLHWCSNIYRDGRIIDQGIRHLSKRRRNQTSKLANVPDFKSTKQLLVSVNGKYGVGVHFVAQFLLFVITRIFNRLLWFIIYS